MLKNGVYQYETILVTGAASFIGQELAAALVESPPTMNLVRPDVIEGPVPAAIRSHTGRITASKSNLTSAPAVAALLSQPLPPSIFCTALCQAVQRYASGSVGASTVIATV